MKELVKFLEPGERKILAGLSALLGALLVFLLAFSLAAGGAFSRRVSAVNSLRRQFQSADRERTALRQEFSQWEEAGRDGLALRQDRFYRESNGINELRLDLQEVFSGVGLEFPQAKFDYLEFEKEKARKVAVSFNFSGSYGLLKQFLAEVEKQPRFLFVERINFLNIDTGSGNLLLKITLAAYYAI
ncbi:MAG: GspMb/PilO family protein [Candidatus Aminicenantales bacterium]